MRKVDARRREARMRLRSAMEKEPRRMAWLAIAIATTSLTPAAALAQQPAASSPSAVPYQYIGWAVLAVIVAVLVIWAATRRSTLLKDNLLPQIEPAKQPFSLARWQMAFWFALIFAAFIGIYAATGQYNQIITPQALWLMGISAGSGIAAVAVDVMKDTPADAANRGLKALGISTYADVERIEAEIKQREEELKAAAPGSATVAQLALEIRDRRLQLTAYRNAIKPYVSEGWYRDITTDLNGTALHRFQTLCWTLALGVVFISGVIANHAFPNFDNSLLILLGISNAGYVGFKYPELQQ